MLYHFINTEFLIKYALQFYKFNVRVDCFVKLLTNFISGIWAVFKRVLSNSAGNTLTYKSLFMSDLFLSYNN